MKHFDSADELRDYLTDLNVGDVPGVEAVAGCVILVTGTPWLAYCTDPDAEWFFECGDPEERMTEDSEGWREYDRIGMDWIGPQVDAHGADLLWPRSADPVHPPMPVGHIRACGCPECVAWLEAHEPAERCSMCRDGVSHSARCHHDEHEVCDRVAEGTDAPKSCACPCHSPGDPS